MYLLIWPTPEALFVAGKICQNFKSDSMTVMETGKRSMDETLSKVLSSKESHKRLVIIAPYVCNPSVRSHLLQITDKGVMVHWAGVIAGDKDYRKELSTISTNIHIMDKEDFDLSHIPNHDEMRSYLQYKIALAFYRTKDNRLDREVLKETILGLIGSSANIPKKDEIAVDNFQHMGLPALEGKSLKITKLKNDIRRVAESGLKNVLLLGESGTGKEAVAFFLHDLELSRRSEKIEIINCASLTEEFLISELFGHEKGAFTGATQKKEGLVAQVDRGTLFLDELPDMTPRVQAMLLRFLQNGEYLPLGSTKKNYNREVKVIAGAQQELLKTKLEKNQFREDLLYRLAGKVIKIPSLREIPDDIGRIIDHLVYKMSADPLKRTETIEYFESRAEELKRFNWPGNIRQLAGIVRRKLFLGAEEEVDLIEDEISSLLPSNHVDHSDNTEAPKIKETECQSKQIFTLLDKESTINIINSGSAEFMNPDDVKHAYIKHCYQCLRSAGDNDKQIAEKLGIAINTLAKHKNIKNVDASES